MKILYNVYGFLLHLKKVWDYSRRFKFKVFFRYSFNFHLTFPCICQQRQNTILIKSTNQRLSGFKKRRLPSDENENLHVMFNRENSCHVISFIPLSVASKYKLTQPKAPGKLFFLWAFGMNHLKKKRNAVELLTSCRTCLLYTIFFLLTNSTICYIARGKCNAQTHLSILYLFMMNP